MSTLTIQSEGVLVFLHAANTATEHAETLLRIRDRRANKESAEADALLAGYIELLTKSRESIEHLRHRGGLLHYMHARVERTIEGEYVVRGSGVDLPVGGGDGR